MAVFVTRMVQPVSGGGNPPVTGFITQSSDADLVIPLKVDSSQNFIVSYIGAEETSMNMEVPTPTVLSAFRVNGIEGCVDIGSYGEYPYLHINDGVLSIETGTNSTTLISPYKFCPTTNESSWFYIIW